MAGANVDPHDKMRARDVNRVARGQQAPHPFHEHDIVSKAPPPSSTDPKPKGEEDAADTDPRFTPQLRICCIRCYEYNRCIQENEDEALECEKFAEHFRVLCPYEWIEKWDAERELGIFPGPI